MLEVTAVRAFADNYIWLAHARSSAREVIAVDPGEARPVIDALREQELSLAAVLLTHHHADHVGGARELVDRFDVPVYGPATETLPVPVQPLREGDRVTLPDQGLAFEVLDIPGHTLFSGGCGRVFEGTPAQLLRSLNKLKALDEDTAVYCGHEYTVANLKFALTVEPDNKDAATHLERCQTLRTQDRPTLPSTIRLERKINPFLRCELETVKRAAEQKAGATIDSDVAVFATVREWKNNYKA